MAELNFGLLNPPGSQSIGNAFVTGMDQAQEARARDLQMQRGQRQDQMAELQLRKAQATETKLNQFYESIAANGGPKSPIEIEDKMIGSGIPDVSQKGLAARSARLQVEEGRKLFGEAMNAGAPPPSAAAAPPPVAAPGDFLAAGNQFMPPMGAVNNMPGAASVPAVNNMPGASAQPDVATLRTRQNGLLALGTPQSLAAARELGRQISDASKPEQFMNVPGVGAINPRTREVIMPAVAPAVADPDTVRQYNFAKTPEGGNYKGTFQDFRVSLRPPGTNVSVDARTGNKFGEAFGAGVAGTDVALRAAALDAPALAANANETLKLLDNPKIFTGGMANIKLELARALNVVGATDTERIANTEQLIRGTGKATLAAIKTSGLGTGQGFTDKDLKMLQGVEGGTIELTPAALREFARAQHNAANAIVKKWDSRRGTMPADVLKATGIDKETYTIPPLRREYVGFKNAPDGRRLGITADGTVEVVK